MEDSSQPPFQEPSKSKIPINRLMLYSLVSTLALPFLVWIYAASHTDEANDALLRMRSLQEEIVKIMNMQKANRMLMVEYANKDPFFLAKNLEPYKTLQKEEETLRNLVSQGGLPELVQQERRLKFLSSGENSFSFVESATLVSPIYKETTETQNKIVELDDKDLMHVLSILEGNPGNIKATRPQLFITEGNIDKKRGYDKETWSISLRLVKRMYTSPPTISKQSFKDEAIDESQ